MSGKRSSVHMRTLSRLGVDLESDVQNLSIANAIQGTADIQDVTGLSGRMRLQKASTNKTSGNWMDKQRQHLQAYEYLCHIGEAKEWIEGCLNQAIPAIVDLEEELRNGVVLARLAKVFVPRLVPRIFEAPKLQFRHSDNINRFFKFVDCIDLPDNFRFELTDLYEKKNIPKVIYCIHALSFVLANSGQAQKIGNLVGKLQFTEAELLQTQKSLDATGVTLPNFNSVGAALSAEVQPPMQEQESSAEQQERELYESTTIITCLQARARGALLRQRISDEFEQLATLETSVIRMQSSARGYLLRLQYYENAHTYRQISTWITSVQAMSTGFLTRHRLNFRSTAMTVNTIPLINVQALSRGHLRRKHLTSFTKSLLIDCDLVNLVVLQSLARGRLLRMLLQHRNTIMLSTAGLNERCQAACRGALLRRTLAGIHSVLQHHVESIVSLQAQCLASIVRKNLARKCTTLQESSVSYVLRLQALARGSLMRRRCRLLISLLAYEEYSVIDTQASCRSFLVRLEHNKRLISLAQAEYEIFSVQTLARGAALRSRYRARLLHYRKNLERVIKVQSFVRAKQQGSAYRSLILDENPPISTIKNFVHLLSDSNFDFEEEVVMEQARKDVVQMIRENEAAEEHIEQMDIKIALLVKQAIKIDEVIQQQRRMDHSIDGRSSISNAYDLKALNKQARSQLENYQKLFYILQTQPVYLARLFSALSLVGTTEKQDKRLESLVMVVFGYAQKKREEYFLLKLVRSSVIKDISESSSVEDFVHKPVFWTRILGNYTRGPSEHKFLQDLLQPIIEIVVEDDFLDLENDPLLIYHSIRQEEESRTGQPSARPDQVTQEYAISDPSTRMMFIKHLRDLRDLTERTVANLEASIGRMPFGIRFIAREAYRAMQEHIEDVTQIDLHHLLGHIIFHLYLTPALLNPEHHRLASVEMKASTRRNLTELSNMLNQIATGRLFEEGTYLQPLNEFLAKAIERMSHIFSQILQVDDIEDHYGISDLDDVVATKHPILYIKASDIFSMHSMVSQNLRQIAPEQSDPLHNVLQALGDPPSRAEDMMIMSLTNMEIALTLDPKAIDMDDPEADERALFIQTKRYVLYIIRVQSGFSLLDILVESVTESDEIRWHEIRRVESSNLQNRITHGHNEQVTSDMSRFSYSMLKRECLQNVVKLEQLGWITRSNRYQELLNSIAEDIKSQNRRRIERQRDLSSTRGTLENLANKRAYLNGQLKSYNDYIEQAMMSLHSKKNKRKSVLPFTKQYFHMRDLQKAGKVPKFGSRKYSASKLYEKGVLISIVNEVPPFEKTNITVSSDQIGLFTLSAAYNGSDMPTETTIVHLEDLLRAQYEKSESIAIFKGRMTVRVSQMLSLVFKHFFSQ